MAMSTIAFGGAAQFAAVGYVTSGVGWPVIVVLTGLLNARHVLYSAALAPWFRGRSFAERAVAAHLLTDESFALSIAHFRRLGRFDPFGYWYAAIVTTLIGISGCAFLNTLTPGMRGASSQTVIAPPLSEVVVVLFDLLHAAEAVMSAMHTSTTPIRGWTVLVVIPHPLYANVCSRAYI